MLLQRFIWPICTFDSFVLYQIYTNVSATSSPQSQTSEVSKRGSDSIFEQRVLPKQETPNITPMRRGRPERKEKDTPEWKSTDESKSNDSFDPFDPKSFSSSTNHKQSAPDFDPAKIFSLNEKTSFTSKADSSDVDSRKSSSRSSMLNTIPTQSSAPQPSTPGVELSHESSSKVGRYQRAVSPSTPDSFSSPKLDTQTQQLIDDNEMLKSSRSGGQLHAPRQSSLGNRAVSPVGSGSDNVRDTRSAPGTPITTATAAKSPLASHMPAGREDVNSVSKPYGPPTSQPRHDNLQKAEQMSDGLVSGHLRNSTDSKFSAAQDVRYGSASKKIPESTSKITGQTSNYQNSRSNNSKSSFSDLVPGYASSHKEDTVESFNRKFPDLSSLDEQLSGSYESSKKSDGSAAFRILDQAYQKESKGPTNSAPPARQSVLDRYQPQGEQADQISKRSSMNSQEASNKGNYIQSKVMEQLQRFEHANNERRSDSQSRRNSTKLPSPSVQKVEREESGSQAAVSPNTEAPIVSKWRRSISQEGVESSPQPAQSAKRSEIAQMNRSIQSFRQMLQSPSPSPTDDGVPFNFEQTQSEKDDSDIVSQKSPSLKTASPKFDISDSGSSKKEIPQDQNVVKTTSARQNPTLDSPSPPVEAVPIPQTQSGPYRPAPPPKPARFRMSAAMAPVMTPSSAAKASKVSAHPVTSATQGLQRPTQKMAREPSISDFESKFPSPEQLQQGLPKD